MTEKVAGVIGIPFGWQPRHTRFVDALLHIQVPDGTIIQPVSGSSVAENRNIAIDLALKTTAEWVFFLDDDHVFDPRILLDLLDRNVDVVGALYCRRSDPFEPLIYDHVREDMWVSPRKLADGESGMIQVKAIGAGGLLVRRRVFEAMQPPYFRLGQILSDQWGDDLDFCRRVTEAGFDIWCDLDVKMGHMMTGIIWPFRTEDGKWERIADLGAKWRLALPEPEEPWHAVSDEPTIARASRIDGWMTPKELMWLADQAFRHREIVEIGSFIGRSTRALADNTPGRVTAIDDWKGPREFSASNKDWLAIFKQAMDGLIESGKVIIKKMDHAKAIKDEPKKKYDMVFIDGDHSYEAVIRDIKGWRKRLLKGGLLAGHDYDFPAVRKAVDELVPDAIIVQGTNIWYVEV